MKKPRTVRMTKSGRFKYWVKRLLNSVTIGIVCIIVIALVLLYTSFRNSRLSEQSADEGVHSISEFYLEELGQRRSQTIASRLNQAAQNMNNVFNIAKQQKIENQKELRDFLQMVKALYGYDKVGIVDENELLYTEHATISGISRYSFLGDKIDKPTVYTVNLYGARKQMVLAMPVKGIKLGKTKLKLCFMQLDLSQMLDEISQQSAESKNDTISNVYYSNGEDMINYSYRESEGTNNILKLLRNVTYMDNHSYRQLSDDFRYGKSGFVSFIRDDVVNYMYYTPIENTKWMFTVTITESSISNNVSGIRDAMMKHNSQQLYTIMVVMVLAFALFILYSRKRQKDEKKTLVKLSQTDAMTGLYNRGGGEKAIRGMLEKGNEGLFILLDADKFKSINDTYGHDVGDMVIIAIADALRGSFRGEDILMRLGGDEFAVYAPGIVNKNAATRVVERLFAALDATHIPELKERKIFVSLGAAFWNGVEQVSFDELYKRSDESLYDSKKVEGNYVNFFEDRAFTFDDIE